ncbi:hypothetical protein HY490_04030 [Candidatus Woesearchaeota archaeon]|nr:hypothetical protein [Candidatus Woesearchaeota archaeon]
MTTVLCDADSLIKLTKAGAKETVVRHLRVIIPAQVKREVVDEARGKPDSTLIERNIRDSHMQVIAPNIQNKQLESEISELHLLGGEEDLYRLSCVHPYDFISSDDQKFLRVLQVVGKKAITPSTIVVLLFLRNNISRHDAQSFLNNLRVYVSDEEYDLCMNELGGAR